LILDRKQKVDTRLPEEKENNKKKQKKKKNKKNKWQLGWIRGKRSERG